MGVDHKCSAYTKHSDNWKKVRDVLVGEQAIREGGTRYLPRPAGMDDSEWKCYLERAHFFGATGRTADGLHGAIFQKKPVLSEDAPEKLKELLADIDRSGRTLDQFASDCVWDALPTNWGGILVDYPSVDDTIDRGTAERLGLRAYAAWYSAESIINWRFETRGNQQVLTFLVLHEPYSRQLAGNEFETENKNRYRVLNFDENGNYQVRIYDYASEGGLTAPVATAFPKIKNENLKFIPFFTFPGKEPDKSMLLDLANENIGHYQKTADYENGLHLTGIPTPYASCRAPINEKGETITVEMGGNRFLWLGDPAATAAYLEFTGQGLSTLEKAIQNCEERMAILGARIISAEKKGVESADAARIHRAGENSVLASFALNASDVLTKVIRLLAQWEDIPGCEEVTYRLNSEYDTAQMEAQLFSAIVQARLSREMPKSVYFWNLQKSGNIPDDMTLEKWDEELALEGDHSDLTGDNPGAGRKVTATKVEKVTK